MSVYCRFIMDISISPSTLIKEKTYVGRIKDAGGNSNIHSKRDLVHAVIYEDPNENFDYLDMKKLVDEDHEGLIFYTTLVDRAKKPATWKRCLDVLRNKPPVGQECTVVHDRPLSFGKFAELAYSKAILTNSDAFNELKSRLSPSAKSPPTLPPPTGSASKRSRTDSDAVKSGIDSAIAMKKSLGLSVPPGMSTGAKQLTDSILDDSVGSNVVLGDNDETHGELSREYWQGRALKAEEKLREFKEKLSVQNDELIELRTDLSKTNSIKEGFAANADLAQVAVRETQALAAKQIIDGLQPHLNVLPKMSKNIETSNAKLNAMETLPEMVKALGDLPKMVKTLLDLPAMITSLREAIEASNERSAEVEDARSSESESVLCFQKRVLKTLDNFGLSHQSKNLNIPDILSSIMSVVGHPSPSSDLSYPTAGPSIHDTSKPPPRAPGASGNTDANNYLLNPRNNNPAPGGLIPTPQYHGDYQPNHGHYGHPPPPPSHGYGPPQGYAHGPSTGYGQGLRHAPAGGPGQGPKYGAGSAQGPSHGYGQPHQGVGNGGKRHYPFVDSQGNEQK